MESNYVHSKASLFCVQKCQAVYVSFNNVGISGHVSIHTVIFY